MNYDDSGETPFLIKKEIIENNLTFSAHVAGIRFMYGLKDELNPTSKVLFLIPCSSLSDTSIATEALLRKEGYNDHEGNTYSLQEIATMMSYYIKNVAKNNPHFNYKEITRGNFYGKNSLLIKECQFIKFNFGYNKNHISPIIQPLGKNYAFINEIYIDATTPCPDSCDLDWPDDHDGNPKCFATLAVETVSSNEKELDEFRYYRDNHLLDLENGAELFEMYYFIAPFIAKIMHKSTTKEIVLQTFYEQEITPFRLLLKEGYTNYYLK